MQEEDSVGGDRWLALDLGVVFVNIMVESTRERFNLDRHWFLKRLGVPQLSRGDLWIGSADPDSGGSVWTDDSGSEDGAS